MFCVVWLLSVFQGKCLRTMAGIEYDMRKVVTRLNSLERRMTGTAIDSGLQSGAAQPSTHTRWDIPFNTDDDLRTTDVLLQDKAKMDSLVS